MKSVRKTDVKVLQSIIQALVEQETYQQISDKFGVSTSLIEKINRCQAHTELHSFQKNIRKESSGKQWRPAVVNEYIEQEEYYILRITNTQAVQADILLDKDDVERVQKYKWTLSIHGDDVRAISNSTELGRIYLHQFLIGDIPTDKVIDHTNRNPLDNRKKNLRIVERSINSTNAKARMESQTNIRGVYFRATRPGISHDSWIAEYSENGKRHTKSFSCEKYGKEEAFRRACSFRETKMKEMKI